MKRNYWLIIVVLALLIAVGIGIFIQTRPEPGGLTESMRLELGAAAYLPETTAVYSSSKHLLPRATAIWRSEAVQNLYRLPTIQMGTVLLSNQKGFQEGKANFNQQPLVARVRPILQDAFANEVFIWGSEDLTRFMTAIKEVTNTIQMLGLKNEEEMTRESGAPDPQLVKEILDILAAREDDLQVPNCMVGFKLTDTEAAARFLKTWMPKLGTQFKVKVSEKTIQKRPFYVLELTGADIPEEVLADMKSEFPDDQQARMSQLMNDRTITAAIGLLDNYLIISVGNDLSALQHWGTGPSLAASPEFKPLRARFQSILTDVQYASGEFLAISGWGANDVNRLSETGEAMLTAMPAGDLKKKLQPRIRKDLQDLCNDLNALIPKPVSYLAFSCDKQGTEWYAIRPAAGSGLKARELTMLGRLGENPIFASACHAAGSLDVYSLAVKWAKVGYGYAKDIAASEMNEEEKEQVQKVESIVVPCLERLDKANRNLLFPALAGTQSITLVDGEGKINELSLSEGPEMSFENPFPVLRVGLAVNLNDADTFKKGVSEYHAAIDSLLTEMKTLETMPPELKQVTIPEVTVEDQSGGQLYHYPWPWKAGSELFPCALLKQRFLYVGLSKSQAIDMLAEGSLPANSVIDLKSPASSACVVKFAPMVKFLEDLNNTALAFIIEKNGGNPALGMERMHADALFRSLRAFKTYTSVSRVEGDHVVKHSWLEVKDID